MTRALGDATWSTLDDRGLLAVPVGATEQHGPHLPLSTDTDIAVALASRLPGAVVSPPLPFGSSGEHQSFPGTLSIGRRALTRVLVELARSAGETFAQVILISTHGGNAQAVNEAVALLRSEGRAVTAWSPRWCGDAHAGRIETSIMLALHPRSVRLDAAEPGNTEPLATLLPTLRAEGVRAVSENGILGDPTGASAEEGRALLDAATLDLIVAAKALRGQPLAVT
jgi:mycofactocin system creatininase family protein